MKTCTHGITGHCLTCALVADGRVRKEWASKCKTLRAARAAVAPELNRPIIEAVADRILEELHHED